MLWPSGERYDPTQASLSSYSATRTSYLLPRRGRPSCGILLTYIPASGGSGKAKTFGIKVLTGDAFVTPKLFGVLPYWSFPQLGRMSGDALMPKVICKRPGATIAVFQGYADGSLLTMRAQYEKQRDKNVGVTWSEEEAALVAFLRRGRIHPQEQLKTTA